jgi:threonine/homoserine/homoserine lactone efflux protein
MGFGAIVEQLPVLKQGLRDAGAAFLFYLAGEAWRGAVVKHTEAHDARGAFFRALVTNILNPKAAAFFLMVLSAFLPDDSSAGVFWPVMLVLLYVLVATVVHAALVMFAATFRPYLVAGSGNKLIHRGFALTLALVATWFFGEREDEIPA